MSETDEEIPQIAEINYEQVSFNELKTNRPENCTFYIYITLLFLFPIDQLLHKRNDFNSLK
jgi:hypothetical protein